MAGDGVGEEVVILGGSAADVVNDIGDALGVLLIGDEHDVGAIARDGAGDEIARMVVLLFLSDLECDTAAFEEGPEIRDPAVIDIFVRLLQSPDSGVFAEVCLHVLVDQLLEVKIHVTEGADDDIGADAAVFGNVAAGVFQCEVGRVVGVGDPDLGAGRADQLVLFGGGDFFTTGEEGEK